MLDLSIYKSIYYEVKLDENLVVKIELPKRKQLKKVLTLTKIINGENLNESDIDNIYEDALIVFLKVIIIGLWRMLIKKNRYSLLS